MIRFRSAAAFVAALSIGVLACVSDLPSGVRARSINVVLGSPTLAVGQKETVAVVLKDEAGNAVEPGVVVWSSSNPAVATVVGAEVTALSTGSTEIAATADGATAAATLTVVPAPPIAVASVSIGLAASSLVVGQTTQATATTRDANNGVLTGRAIAWSSDNTSVASVSATGVVTAVAAGTANITATSEGRSAHVPVTITPVPPVPVGSVSVTLNSSALTTGQTTQATATTRDASNTVLTGRAIAWSSSNTAVATVSASGLVMAVGAGSAQIVATSETKSGSAPVQVTAPPVVGPATQLAMATQPAGAVSGLAFTTQPVVQVRDAAGALSGTSSAAVTAALTGGTGTLLGTTTVNAVNGVATFRDLRVNGAGTYTLTFTATGLTSATSASFTVTQAVASLAVQTQPAGATSGVSFTTQPVVRLLDNAGLLASTATTVVRAALTTGTGTLTGTTSVAAINGVATFTDLKISGSGATVLTFSTTTPALQVASASFVVAPAAPTQLTITTQPATSASSGVTFSRQPVLQVRDAAGGAVPQAGVVVTAAIATGGGTLNGTTTALTNASGVASFTNLSITGTDGSRTLSFSAPGLTGATSTAVVLAPVATTDEPQFDGSSTLVLQDNMDSYTTATAMGATSSSTAPRIVPNPSPVATSQAVNTYSNQVITGRNGTGKALRMGYTGVYQQGATFYTLNQPSTPILATHYFQYWGRVNFSAALNGTVAIKWFEAWHTGRDRVQWNTHAASSAHVGKQWTYWQVYDQGRETPGQGDQPIGPYFNDLNDNQWHRYTYAYKPNSSSGARDGFARMWVDGKKIIDISAATMNVTPVGGDKPWCTSADVDALTVNEGITNLVWGSTQTTTTPAWTYDIDDLVWWRK